MYQWLQAQIYTNDTYGFPKSMLRPAQSVLKPPGSTQVNLMPHSGLTSCEMASVKPCIRISSPSS